MKINSSIVCRGAISAACSVTMMLFAASPQIALAQTSTEAPAAAQQSLAQTGSTAPSRTPARVTQKVDNQSVVSLHGGVHRLARTQFDRGAVPDSQPADHMVLTLKRSKDQEAALRELLVEQQDKTSKNFHAWLTPDQFGKQFGPADSDVQAVTRTSLTSRGFSEIKVSPGRMRVEFSGNVGQVRNAFHTDVHHFMVNGKMHMAGSRTRKFRRIGAGGRRRSFAPRLSSQGTRAQTGHLPAQQRDRRSETPFHFHRLRQRRRSAVFAVGPGDFAKIYNVPATVNGAYSGQRRCALGNGLRIGIVQDSNINIADVQAYRTLFGLDPNAFDASHVVLNGPDPGIQGPDSFTDDEIEADLDVQIAGGVAPAGPTSS